ncbi:glycoside hydrolase [Sinomicrobium pectinilyticum]|nr:glycoside hydrolase [Sinomicrobium pectinilyticum]
MKSKRIFGHAVGILSISFMVIGCAPRTGEDEIITEIDDPSTEITLDWDKTYQEIDGFGTFAGRAKPLYESENRDSIIEYLWGPSGLQLNMIRAEILYEYPFDENSGEVTVPGNAEINAGPGGIYHSLGEIRKQQIAQGWILKNVEEKYQVPIKLASAWSPPLYMRLDSTQGHSKVKLPEIPGFSNLEDAQRSIKILEPYIKGEKLIANGVNPEKRPDFARYLAGFVNAYKEMGIEFDAISPSNEPDNVVSEWVNAFWMPGDLGRFISDDLRPALDKEGLQDVKIIGPENAGWATNDLFLNNMDRSNIDIYAGHGYKEIMMHIGERLVRVEEATENTEDFESWYNALNEALSRETHGDLNTDPIPWSFSTGDKKVWLTEASDDSQQATGKGGDASMSAGLKLATQMHKFLTLEGNSINAYVYWLGMLDNDNNEALIWDINGSLKFPKTYDVMGHFSRDIEPGYIRFGAKVNKHPEDLLPSAYRDPDTGKMTVVIVNRGSDAYRTTLNPGFDTDELKGYQTTDNSTVHWKEEVVVTKEESGKWTVLIPAKSVITLVGERN